FREQLTGPHGRGDVLARRLFVVASQHRDTTEHRGIIRHAHTPTIHSTVVARCRGGRRPSAPATRYAASLAARAQLTEGPGPSDQRRRAPGPHWKSPPAARGREARRAHADGWDFAPLFREHGVGTQRAAPGPDHSPRRPRLRRLSR